MLINLSELFPVEGTSKTYTPELEMTQFRLADTVYDIAEKGPLSLVITNRGNKKLALAGTSDLVLIMPCARSVSYTHLLGLDENFNERVCLNHFCNKNTFQVKEGLGIIRVHL